MLYKSLFIILFLFCTVTFGQYNPYSDHIKRHDFERYMLIKKYANKKWKDSGAVQFEINKQSEGYINVMKLLHDHWECQSHKTIITMEMLKYSTDSENFSGANWWRIYQEIKGKMD